MSTARVWTVNAFLIACGCAPTPQDPAVDVGTDVVVERHPGYCTALSEYVGQPGPSGVRRARYEGETLVADEFDSDDDGDVDAIGRYDYEDDLLIRWENDEFADGTTDEVRTYEWDDEGRMTHERWDLGADDTIDMDIRYEHDSEGRRTQGFGHSDDDQATDLQLWFGYDDAGNLTILEMDGLRGKPDGEADRVINHDYDEVGNQLTSFFDFDANGLADLRVTYTYDCWR